MRRLFSFILVSASLFLVSAAPAQADDRRVIRVHSHLTESAWWGFRGAVRDWNQAAHVRFVVARHEGPDVFVFTEFEEMEPGTVERAVMFDWGDGSPIEVSLNYTQAEWRERAYRRSAACSGLGMLVQNLPDFQHLGSHEAPASPWSSCMDPAAEFTYPLPASMLHPGPFVLSSAR